MIPVHIINPIMPFPANPFQHHLSWPFDIGECEETLGAQWRQSRHWFSICIQPYPSPGAAANYAIVVFMHSISVFLWLSTNNANNNGSRNFCPRLQLL